MSSYRFEYLFRILPSKLGGGFRNQEQMQISVISVIFWFETYLRSKSNMTLCLVGMSKRSLLIELVHWMKHVQSTTNRFTLCKVIASQFAELFFKYFQVARVYGGYIYDISISYISSIIKRFFHKLQLGGHVEYRAAHRASAMHGMCQIWEIPWFWGKTSIYLSMWMIQVIFPIFIYGISLFIYICMEFIWIQMIQVGDFLK